MDGIEQNRNRHSTRLTDYDYSSRGAYFVTICAYRNQHLFGQIKKEQMQLNTVGRIVDNEWLNIPGRFPNVFLDKYIVMPNHMHGIIIVGATLAVALSDQERAGASPAPTSHGPHIPCKDSKPTLGEIVGAFKSLSNRKWCKYIEDNNFLDKYGRLWQRSYYDRIIRNERELNQIRKYISENPLKWRLEGRIIENL